MKKTPKAFSRRLRHSIYKDVLIRHDKINDKRHPGLCVLICGVIYRKGYGLEPNDVPKLFPEIADHMPCIRKTYWWPLEDFDSRRKVLIQAIEETNTPSLISRVKSLWK
jgi:hypothetical protein